MTHSRKYNSFLLIAGLAVSLFLATISVAGQTRLRGVMVSPDKLKASDLETLGQWKANLIRWQLVLQNKDIISNLALYRQWLDGQLNQIDQLLRDYQGKGLRVVIDLHTPPGGYDAAAGEHRIFRDSAYRRETVATWEKIAYRYKDNSVVWGYDLVNEPHFRDVRRWQNLAQELATKIREIERGHISHRIIVESRYGHPNHIDELRPLSNISNVVYSVHMYDPIRFTHQGTPRSTTPEGEIKRRPTGFEYPGTFGGTYFDRDELKRRLKPVGDFQRRYRVPIYIGEFSASCWAPEDSSYRYLSHLIGIFEENGWDWTYHAFREADDWSVEHCPDPQNPTKLQLCTAPSSRQLLLQRAFARNR